MGKDIIEVKIGSEKHLLVKDFHFSLCDIRPCLRCAMYKLVKNAEPKVCMKYAPDCTRDKDAGNYCVLIYKLYNDGNKETKRGEK